MKRFFLSIVVVVSLSACHSDALDIQGRELEKEENDNCEGKSFSYIDDIKEIIAKNCSLSGCHVEGNNQDLPVFTTYQDVFESRGLIGYIVGSRSMPPPTSGIMLTNNQINAIVCWVKTGAPE